MVLKVWKLWIRCRMGWIKELEFVSFVCLTSSLAILQSTEPLPFHASWSGLIHPPSLVLRELHPLVMVMAEEEASDTSQSNQSAPWDLIFLWSYQEYLLLSTGVVKLVEYDFKASSGHVGETWREGHCPWSQCYSWSFPIHNKPVHFLFGLR